MRRNTSIIVRRLFDGYDIMIPGHIGQADLFYSEQAYAARKTPAGHITDSEVCIADPAGGTHVYFTAVLKDGREVTAGDPRVDIPSVSNFRDLGGYLTEDGRTVKWGTFFRSAAPGNLSEKEQSYFNSLGLRTILDYRAKQEAEQFCDYVSPGTEYKGVPSISPTRGGEQVNLDMAAILRSVKTEAQAEEITRGFMGIYRELPFNNPSYHELFSRLDTPEKLPLLQHCTAGKDRTGLGSALLLIALGVDEETVIEDYCLSALYRERENRAITERMSASAGAAGEAQLTAHAMQLAASLLTVSRPMIESAFAAVREKYPSFEAFFQGEYGITRERITSWRNAYLTA